MEGEKQPLRISKPSNCLYQPLNLKTEQNKLPLPRSKPPPRPQRLNTLPPRDVPSSDSSLTSLHRDSIRPIARREGNVRLILERRIPAAPTINTIALADSARVLSSRPNTPWSAQHYLSTTKTHKGPPPQPKEGTPQERPKTKERKRHYSPAPGDRRSHTQHKPARRTKIILLHGNLKAHASRVIAKGIA